MDLEGPGGGGRAMLLSLPEGVLRLITGAADPHAELFFRLRRGSIRERIVGHGTLTSRTFASRLYRHRFLRFDVE